jgi:soluble lytic murein transglycosylase
MTARERLFAPHRLAIAGVVALLAIVALVASRGPSFIQRFYHPLAYEKAIAAASARHGVDPYLVAAVVAVESSFRPDAVSSHGATGLMQVLPSTAEELFREGDAGGSAAPPTALLSPEINLEYGAAYLSQLLRRFEDTRTALAAYNAGPATVATWLKRPGGGKITYADVSFPETKRYVKRVLREVYYYRRLYPEAFK